MQESCVVVLTNRTAGCSEFDRRQSFPIYRANINPATIPIPFVSSLIRYSVLITAAVYLVLRYRVSVIHCGEPEPAGVVGYILHILFRMPYMMYVHDDPEIPGLRWYPKLMRHCYRKSSGIIAACSQARRNVMRYGIDGGRIAVIRTALQKGFLNLADPSPVRDKHSLHGKKVLLTVGRLVEEKGHDEVLRLLPTIVQSTPDVVYLIVGKGPEEKRLRELVRQYGLTDNVVFTGFVLNNELPSYYAACDLFIMLNKEKNGVAREGLGMVFLEANAQAKTVIGSTSGGTADAIVDGETGYRIPLSQEETLAGRVTELLIDEQKRLNVGMNGRGRVLRDFADWQSCSESLYRFTKASCITRHDPERGLTFEEKDPHPVYN
jgi:phosphatidylinositol alpha-1,6-mannosyltransferase